MNESSDADSLASVLVPCVTTAAAAVASLVELGASTRAKEADRERQMRARSSRLQHAKSVVTRRGRLVRRPLNAQTECLLRPLDA